MSSADRVRQHGHDCFERAPAGRREWLGIAALMLPCMLVVMDLSVLFPAVPTLTADLRAGPPVPSGPPPPDRSRPRRLPAAPDG